MEPTTSNPVILPKGYGFRALRPGDLTARGHLLDLLQIWEPPRTRGPRRYVLGVDVSDGLGLDRSVIEVVRAGTLEEPAEQVAEFVTDSVTPMALAYVIQAVGEYYRDDDQIEALVAIEGNNHGLSTQDTLQLHLGYQSHYRWEYYDAADPSKRYSQKIGWLTTTRTRPLLLDRLYSALTTLDPITHTPDLLTHSSILHDELKDFQTDGALWEAAAARGAHDDCVMALGIANYVAWRLQAGESEPLEERRRRRAEQVAADARAATTPIKADWRNTPCDVGELHAWEHGEVGDEEEGMYDLLAGR